MDPSTVALFKAVISFVLLSGTGLMGYWLRARARALPDAGLRDEVIRLREEVERLQQLAESRVPEVEERLDFVERRLVGAPREPRSAGHPTPA